MGRVQKHVLRLTTDGSGDAVGVVNFGFNADYQSLVRVKVDYSATADAGTDITIEDGDGGTVMTLTNTNTDFDGQPLAGAIGADGALLDTAGDVGYAAPLVRGPLTVTVAQGGASKTNEVTLWLQN